MTLATALALLPGAAAACAAHSGPRTTALVELYTARSCDACPAAERWIAGLHQRSDLPSGVLAMVLRLDAVDYEAQGSEEAVRRRIDRRQYGLARMRRVIVTVPRVLLQGREFDGWASAQFAPAVAGIVAMPARVALKLVIEGARAGALDVVAEVLHPAPAGAGAALYLASFQLRGRLVRAWQGPLPLRPDGGLRLRHELPLPAGVAPQDSGVVAFVESGGGSREVLQALELPFCAEGGVR